MTMTSLLLILALSAAPWPIAAVSLPALPPPEEKGVLLRYDLPLGQVAEYRIVLDVRGEQTSLGETLPLQWRAELEVTEEVVARAIDGTLWLRVRGRIVKAKDATGAFASAMPVEYPAVQMRITPLGEVIDASVATGETAGGPRDRAFIALLSQPGLPILPAYGIEEGDEWCVDTGDDRQTNTLVSLSESDLGTVALVSTSKSARIAMSEGSSSLGLHTDLGGSVAEESELRLLVQGGLVLSHKGKLEVRTNSTASLILPEGTETFDMGGNFEVDFDLQLIAIDGKPVGAS